MGTHGLRGRLDVADEAFLHYSGHFSHFPRSALALECLLEDYLRTPTRVLQVQGRWLNLEPHDQARLPPAAKSKGPNNQLGVDAVIGPRVWDVQSKFRLRLGPLSWPRFCSLMPNGVALRPLCQMARAFVGPELDFDVQPVLEPEDVVPCRLSLGDDDGFYLGWNAWLPARSLDRQVDDALFVLDDA
jgi:type VI secretion system protein ImpH